MVNLKDVAKKVSVSIATVSLALNNSPLVNSKTKERVKYWAKKLNYVPNVSGQRLVNRRSYNLKCFFNSKDYYTIPINFLRVLNGIISESEKLGYSLSFTYYSTNEVNSFTEIQNKAINIKNIDGILILNDINKELLNSLKLLNTPIIVLNNCLSFKDIYSVDNDDFGGSYKIVKHLIELGHKNICYVGLPESDPFGREAWKGFKKALAEHRIMKFYQYEEPEINITFGKNAIEFLFKENILPTAFFCISDYIAIGVIEGLKKLGYKVPDDFSVVGIDDNEISSDIDPPLTTLRVRMERIGELGVKIIDDIINNKYKGNKHTVVGNELILRKSCKELIH